MFKIHVHVKTANAQLTHRFIFTLLCRMSKHCDNGRKKLRKRTIHSITKTSHLRNSRSRVCRNPRGPWRRGKWSGAGSPRPRFGWGSRLCRARQRRRRCRRTASEGGGAPSLLRRPRQHSWMREGGEVVKYYTSFLILKQCFRGLLIDSFFSGM